MDGSPGLRRLSDAEYDDRACDTAILTTLPPLTAVALQLDDPSTGAHWCTYVAQADFIPLRGDRLGAIATTESSVS